ncbi:hypothetical protein GGF46_001874 [Coemansia sp. RSA 552]|nr:hypothetical protein GGF46_001874 [Coemansia sp. RSA 552]
MARHTLVQRREFAAKTFCPRILVLGSSSIDDACAVNSCRTFADLLAPFGQDVSTQITIQDGQGAPYFLDRVSVKFVTDFKIERQRQRNRGEIDKLVQREAMAVDGKNDVPFMSSRGIDGDAVAAGDVNAWTPWYTVFRQQWVAETQPSEHESFLHPVACVLVASGSEEDPVATLRSLQSQAVVQRAQSQGFNASSLLVYYLLVHDGRDQGVLQTIDQKFDQVRRAFGQNSSLLKINSSAEPAEDADMASHSKISTIWSSNLAATHPLSPSADVTYGSMLTMRDVAALRDAVKQIMVRSVVPHMQYMIRVLSDQTANQRRGLTGRLFSAGRRYFGASTKTSSTLTGVDGDTYFRYDSPEAQMRKLADYSFMLKDFRFAQSVYQVARRDFQSEKAWKCYAGAQEMVGVCKLMLEVHATKAEFDTNFEDAVAVYLHKTHVPCQHLAVRCTIIYYELLRHHKLYSFAPPALLRIPPSFGALYALAAEQAAFAYLQFPRRPELRKFSFYAMVAGQAYRTAGVGALAHRCLRMVHMSMGTSVYHSSKPSADKSDSAVGGEGTESSELPAAKWPAIDSYINHELGRQCMEERSYNEALDHFMALMSDDQIPAKLQSKYLQELLQLFLEGSDGGSQQSDKPLELSIPTIDPLMTRILMSPELEGEDGVFSWRADGSAPASQQDDGANTATSRCCSVGEDVAVLLVVKNPLTVGITLNSFTLECDFTAADGTDAPSPAFDVSTADAVILEGGQASMVTVTVTPHCAGSLEVRGARFLLCDILPVYKPLVLPGRRLNETKEQRVTPTYSPDARLGFRVDQNFPRVEAVLGDFPDTLMSGSMHCASIRLTNRSSTPCQNIALWMSHPSFFDVRSPHSPDDDADAQPIYIRTDSIQTTKKVEVANVLRDCSLFILAGQAVSTDTQAPYVLKPADSLGPGESLTVPVWIRGDRVGAHTLSMLVGTSTTQETRTLAAGGGCKMRTRKFEVDLVVTPSLRVNAFVRPSMRNPSERILGIEIENMQTNLDIQLVQTTFSSGYYELVPLRIDRGSDDGEAQTIRVESRQTVNLMYRAQPFRKTEDDRDESQPAPELFAIGALRQFIFSNDKPTALPEPIELIYSNTVIGDQGIDCIHSPLQGYIARSQAHRRRNVLRNAYPLIPEKYQSVLFPLYETFGIDFVLFWAEVGGSARSGHHSITGIDLGVPHDYLSEATKPPDSGIARAWLKDTVQEREALVQSIRGKSAASRRSDRPLDVAMRVVDVKPSTGSSKDAVFYSADIEVTVHNHSWRHTYDGVLSLISPTDVERRVPKDSQLDYSGMRSAWSWYGTIKHTVSVKPHGSVLIRASVACCSLGVVDIGLWELNAQSRLQPDLPHALSEDAGDYEYRLYPLHPCFVNLAVA